MTINDLAILLSCYFLINFISYIGYLLVIKWCKINNTDRPPMTVDTMFMLFGTPGVIIILVLLLLGATVRIEDL